MTDFLNRMFGRNNDEDDEKGSSATAKDRLKMVLTHDRIQVSPKKLAEMRTEIIAVIAKYVPEIDPDSVDISIEQTDRYNNRIVAQIPFSKGRGKPSIEKTGNTDLLSPLEDATTVPHLAKGEGENIVPPRVFDSNADEDTILTASKSEIDDTLPRLDDSGDEETIVSASTKIIDDGSTQADKPIEEIKETDDTPNDN